MRFMMAVLLGGMLAVGSMIMNQSPSRQAGTMNASFSLGETTITAEPMSRMILLPTSEKDAVATIRFYHESFSLARLYILNRDGYRVRTLVQKFLPGGVYQISWYGESDGARRLPAGVYIVVYKTESTVEKKKVVIP